MGWSGSLVIVGLASWLSVSDSNAQSRSPVDGSIRLTDESGAPLSDVTLRVVSRGPRFYPTQDHREVARSDERGVMVVPRRTWAGELFLFWRADRLPAYLPIEGGLPETLVLDRGRTVVCELTRTDGSPATDVRTTLSPLPVLPDYAEITRGGEWIPGADRRCAVWSAVAGADGVARVPAVPIGSFIVQSWHPSLAPFSGPQETAIRVGPKDASVGVVTMAPIVGFAFRVSGDELLGRATLAVGFGGFRPDSGPSLSRPRGAEAMLDLAGAALRAAHPSASAIALVHENPREPAPDQPMDLFLATKGLVPATAELRPIRELFDEVQVIDARTLGRTRKTGRVRAPGAAVGDAALVWVTPERTRNSVSIRIRRGVEQALPVGRYRYYARSELPGFEVVEGKVVEIDAPPSESMRRVRFTVSPPWTGGVHGLSVRAVDSSGKARVLAPALGEDPESGFAPGRLEVTAVGSGVSGTIAVMVPTEPDSSPFEVVVPLDFSARSDGR